MGDEKPRCGGCHGPIGRERTKCRACGWILLSDPFECLSRDDLPERQRQAIELELSAVAQTGPQRPGEPRESYSRRVRETMQRLADQL